MSAPELPSPLPEGFLPGRYEDARPLGLGGMAAVYQAYDSRVGRSVVVKVLDEGRIGPSELDECRRRFVTEARAAAAIHHPNIITILDTETGPDGRPYIVMEHMPRGSLRAWIDAGGLADPPTVAGWITSAARALQAAHRADVVHRDVKPDNMLLDADGWLKVSDFGIARVRSTGASGTRTGMMLGTPGFMAPEIWANAAGASPASDVWALAATAYQLLTGVTPYGGGFPQGPCPPASRRRPGLPAAVDAVLAAGLATDPADRPSAVAFAGDLAAALEDATAAGETVPIPVAPADPVPPTRVTTPSPAEQPTVVAPPPPPGPRRRRRAAALVATAVLVLGGGIAAGVAVLSGDEASGEAATTTTTTTTTTDGTVTTAAGPTTPPLGPREEVRVASLLAGGGPEDNCFGPGERPNGTARFTLRPGEAARETDFVQCGRQGDPAGADGVYRFGAPPLPAGTRVVAVEGFFGIEPNSRADHPSATVRWVVSYAGRELCAPEVGPGLVTDERIGGRACRIPDGVAADAGTLEIAQAVSEATAGTRLYAGVVAPTLVVRRPV